MIKHLEQLSPIEALELTIIGEARGEPIEGQIAVACVIRNRLKHNPSKYEDYRDVCFENRQFSCWNNGSPEEGFLQDLVDKIVANQESDIVDPYLIQCMWVAEGISENKIQDNTSGAKNYITASLFKEARPSWAIKAYDFRTYGKHIFFKV